MPGDMLVQRSDLAAYAHGGFATDYEARIEMPRLRAERLAAARAALAASELDALFVWKDENVRYLSGLRAQLIQGKTALLNGCPADRGRAASSSSPAARSTASSG